MISSEFVQHFEASVFVIFFMLPVLIIASTPTATHITVLGRRSFLLFTRPQVQMKLLIILCHQPNYA